MYHLNSINIYDTVKCFSIIKFYNIGKEVVLVQPKLYKLN